MSLTHQDEKPARKQQELTEIDIEMQERLLSYSNPEVITLKSEFGGELKEVTKRTVEIRKDFTDNFRPSTSFEFAIRSATRKALRLSTEGLEKKVENIVTGWILNLKRENTVYNLWCKTSPYILIRQREGHILGVPLFLDVLDYHKTFKDMFPNHPETEEPIQENMYFEFQLKEVIEFKTGFGDYTPEKAHDLYSFLRKTKIISEESPKPENIEPLAWKNLAGYLRLMTKKTYKKDSRRITFQP